MTTSWNKPKIKNLSWTRMSSIRSLKSISLISLSHRSPSRASVKRTLLRWLKFKDVSFHMRLPGEMLWLPVEQGLGRLLRIWFHSSKSSIVTRSCPSTVLALLSWCLSENSPCRYSRCSTHSLITWKSVLDLSLEENQLSTNNKRSESWTYSSVLQEGFFSTCKKPTDFRQTTYKCLSLMRQMSCSIWDSEILSTQFCKVSPDARHNSFQPLSTTKSTNYHKCAWKSQNVFSCTLSGTIKSLQLPRMRKRILTQFMKHLPSLCNIIWW